MTHPITRMFRVLRLGQWRALRWGLVLPIVPVLWACSPHPMQAPDPHPEQVTDLYVDINPVRKVDILVMVDNSPSMREEQANLARNFPAFIKQLQSIEGGMPDIQIAVVSSDMGAGGSTVGENCLGYGDGARFQYLNAMDGQNCGLQGDARYIRAFNKGAGTNLQPGKTLEAVFACMATRGDQGCGYEHQLQAVRVGLQPQSGLNPANANFIRNDAYLAILLVTDEDDCSAPPGQAAHDFFVSDIKGQAPSLRCSTDGHLCNGKPISIDPMMSTALAACGANPNPSRLIRVEDFVRDIKALKPLDRIIVAGIIGVPQPGKDTTARYSVHANPGKMNDLELSPVCSTPGLGLADSGLRMKQFIDAFAPNSSVHSICNEDFSPALAAVGQLVGEFTNPICVTQPLVDRDPTTPAVDPDCLVKDQRAFGNTLVDVPLPHCNAGQSKRPCWDITPNPMTCSASGFQVNVFRPDGVVPPPGSKLAIKCRTCAGPNDPRCASR